MDFVSAAVWERIRSRSSFGSAAGSVSIASAVSAVAVPARAAVPNFLSLIVREFLFVWIKNWAHDETKIESRARCTF